MQDPRNPKSSQHAFKQSDSLSPSSSVDELRAPSFQKKTCGRVLKEKRSPGAAPKFNTAARSNSVSSWSMPDPVALACFARESTKLRRNPVDSALIGLDVGTDFTSLVRTKLARLIKNSGQSGRCFLQCAKTSSKKQSQEASFSTFSQDQVKLKHHTVSVHSTSAVLYQDST